MTALATSREDHWKEHARQWTHIGQPLRPSQEDLALLEAHQRNSTVLHLSAGTALLLGVTPELARLAHEVLGYRLIAVDRSLPMIQSVWTTDTPRSMVVQGDWCHLPVAAGSVDTVMGDGCFTTMGFPEGYRQVLIAISHALKPGGIFSMRFFASPVVAEKTDKVFADLYAGAIGNFHIFKWRLAMSLLDRKTWNIPVERIWQSWHDAVAAPDDLARQLGWSPIAVRTIDVYRDSPAIYSFPALPALLEVLMEYFDELGRFTPTYELGNRCPTIILRKKS